MSLALELGLPVVVALALVDVAAAKGIAIDSPALAARLGCAVVPVAAPIGRGIEAIRDAIVAAASGPSPPRPDLVAHLANVPADRPAAEREAIARYAWIEWLLARASCRREPAAMRPSLDERIDALLTHRVWGTLAFAAVMLALFTAIFTLAAPLMDLISSGVEAVAGAVEAACPRGRSGRSWSTA